MDAFAKGTYGVAATLAELTGKGCITIIGGGGETQYIPFFS
jgi:phosphoglycerate kinase